MAVAMAFASYLLTLDEAHRVNAEAMLAKWQHPDLHFAFPVVNRKGQSGDDSAVSVQRLEHDQLVLGELHVRPHLLVKLVKSGAGIHPVNPVESFDSSQGDS